MDEGKLVSAVDRATRANILVNDELLKDSFQKLEQGYYKQWLASNDPAERDRCHLAITMIKHVQADLHRVVQNGSVALLKLNAIRDATRAA